VGSLSLDPGGEEDPKSFEDALHLGNELHRRRHPADHTSRKQHVDCRSLCPHCE
jgi:hypothetical protein